MTIHTDWPRVLYEECPEAFNTRTPGRKVVCGSLCEWLYRRL